MYRGLTNFDPDDFDTYQEALRVYYTRYGKNATKYKISLLDMDGNSSGLYSFHVEETFETSGDFWNVFDEVNQYLPTVITKFLAKVYPK